MRAHERTLTFGWDGDDGLGMRLIQQVLDGTKTATCAPLFGYTANELADIYASKGALMRVTDKEQRPWCTVCMVDVFQTTFGAPDPRLVSGEGDGDDAEKFRREHREDWKTWLESEGRSLTDETILVVQVFALSKDDE